MKKNTAICLAMLLLVGCASTSKNVALPARDEPLLAVTPKVELYSSTTVLPRLDDKRNQDGLAQLLLVSKILIAVFVKQVVA